MTTNGSLHPSIQNLVDYAKQITPIQQINPADLLPGGKYQVPAGFSVNIDAWNERVWLYGPHDEPGIQLKTLVAYGEFKIQGADLLRGFAQLLGRGEPFGLRTTLDEKHQYFLKLLASADPFTMPAKATMTRKEMDLHVAACEACRPVHDAFVTAIDAGVSIGTEAHFREMITKAHANREEALAYYRLKAKRMKPAAIATAQEV